VAANLVKHGINLIVIVHLQLKIQSRAYTFA
jgi:hypothetical protein